MGQTQEGKSHENQDQTRKSTTVIEFLAVRCKQLWKLQIQRWEWGAQYSGWIMSKYLEQLLFANIYTLLKYFLNTGMTSKSGRNINKYIILFKRDILLQWLSIGTIWFPHLTSELWEVWVGIIILTGIPMYVRARILKSFRTKNYPTQNDEASLLTKLHLTQLFYNQACLKSKKWGVQGNTASSF